MAARDGWYRSAMVAAVVLGYAVAFAVALAEFPGSGVIQRFALPWELSRAASLLAAWMPSLLFAACAASMSLRRDRGLQFSVLLRPVLVPALVMALLYSVLELTVLPGVRGMQERYESLSSLYRETLRGAEEALKAGDIPRAQERIALVGAIDSREPAYRLLNEQIQREYLRVRQADGPAADPRAPPPPPDDGASAYEFHQKARGFLRRGDYYSAHWYAGRALILDPSRRDALQLQAEAWRRIGELAADSGDQARSAFHARKAAAYVLLQSGDYLAAYRAFTDLSRINPRDPDVIRYLKESMDRLGETSFFADDYRQAFAVGGSGTFTVRTIRDGIEHVLHASRVAAAGPFLYMEDFEFMAAGAGGPVLHVQAPAARLRGLSPPSREAGVDTAPASAVSLRMVERAFPRDATRPTYLVGRPAPPAETVLVLPMDSEALLVLLELQDQVEHIPFPHLLDGARIAREYGLAPGPYRMETLLRFSIPVMMAALALLGTALGARFRRDEEPGHLRFLLALPLLGILASVPISAANRMGEHILHRLFTGLPEAGATAAWAGILALLLTLSFLAVGRLGVHAPDQG
ncbi:MAG TPA: hypothetical protein VLH39_06410 [Magnetospirillaceae bacterium]|nr:hypothetical protein [Magnetospirillaceae bacterium]